VSKSPVSKVMAMFASEVLSMLNLHRSVPGNGQGTRDVVYGNRRAGKADEPAFDPEGSDALSPVAYHTLAYVRPRSALLVVHVNDVAAASLFEFSLYRSVASPQSPGFASTRMSSSDGLAMARPTNTPATVNRIMMAPAAKATGKNRKRCDFFVLRHARDIFAAWTMAENGVSTLRKRTCRWICGRSTGSPEDVID